MGGAEQVEHLDAVFPNYRGKGRYTVRHPSFGECRVAARTEEAAIVAAADFFKTKWTKISFYAECHVVREDRRRKT